jgi:DNA-binding LytR/AlgR family response regulator
LIALLIDEEVHSRQRLSRLLREIAPEFTGIAEANNDIEAVTKIERFSPNLIFTTSQIGSNLQEFMLNGRAHKTPKVIVAKDYNDDQPAIQKFGGLYLVKPVDAQHLRDVLDAVGKISTGGIAKAVNGSNANGINGNHITNGHGTSNGNGQSFLNRLVVRRQGRFRFLSAEKVIWFGTEFRLVYAHTEIRRYPIDLGLDQLEQRLDPSTFVRIHRSAIVNINRIKEIVPLSGGRSKVLLGEPEERALPLSASRAKAIKEILSDKINVH